MPERSGGTMPGGALPPQVKITLPRIEVDGWELGRQLAGDYILDFRYSSLRRVIWSVHFEPLGSFRLMKLALQRDQSNHWQLHLVLAGQGEELLGNDTRLLVRDFSRFARSAECMIAVRTKDSQPPPLRACPAPAS
jgi:hypothetical protein